MSDETKASLLGVLHRWGPWVGALLLFVVLTVAKATMGYAEEVATVDRLSNRVAGLDAIGTRIDRRLDRVEKSLARIDCKMNGPGISCDAAVSAIGELP